MGEELLRGTSFDMGQSHGRRRFSFEELKQRDLFQYLLRASRGASMRTFVCARCNKKKTSKIQVTDSVSHLVICSIAHPYGERKLRKQNERKQPGAFLFS